MVNHNIIVVIIKNDSNISYINMNIKINNIDTAATQQRAHQLLRSCSCQLLRSCCSWAQGPIQQLLWGPNVVEIMMNRPVTGRNGPAIDPNGAAAAAPPVTLLLRSSCGTTYR